MSVRNREKRVCVCASEIERHVDLHKTVRTNKNNSYAAVYVHCIMHNGAV